MSVLYFLITAAAAYILGCSNGAVLVSKYILHDDVRTHGSGNAGLTNFYRVYGGWLTFLVILVDVLKMVIAVLIGLWLIGHLGGAPVLAKYFAGFFCLLGHNFPFMFGFKGGKGVLSGGTLALMIDWRVALVVWGGFLILAILTRYVSLGSVWAGASFPFISVYVYPSAVIFLLAAGCGGLLVWGHRGNIVRLIHGKESKFTFHRKKEGET